MELLKKTMILYSLQKAELNNINSFLKLQSFKTVTNPHNTMLLWKSSFF